jgi:hypothetical protein
MNSTDKAIRTISVEKSPLHSVESRALTHLESIDLGNATFISMGGPQAHGNSQPHPGTVAETQESTDE